MNVLLGWWLQTQPVKLSTPEQGVHAGVERKASLYTSTSSLSSVTVAWNPKALTTFVGFTSDPAEVMAWINDGTLPKEATPVKDLKDPMPEH